MICGTDKGLTKFLVAGKYEGEWKDGKMHGQGTMIYSDGGNYKGEWKDGNKHGQGTVILFDGDKYEVEWKDGKMHGQGTNITPSGHKYEGEWKNGNKHGQGTYIYPNGDKYEVEWKDGECRETGRFIEKNVTSNGWVYIILSPSLQNSYLKIGMTKRTPEIRAREMSEETGMLAEYYVAYKREVYDCEKVAALVHSELDKFRITSTRNDREREFFKLSLQKAIATMNNYS